MRRKANVCVCCWPGSSQAEREPGGPDWFRSIPGDAPAACRKADGMETSGPPSLH